MLLDILKGALAGAAGTTALDAVTYLDMAGRGRPASGTPSETVERLAEKAGVGIPGEGEQRKSRVSGVGALLGIATGVAMGAAYGALRGAGLRPPVLVGAGLVAAVTMAGTNAPMVGLGISDPRTWSSTDWLSDVVPHAVYGLVTAGACALFDGERPGRRAACGARRAVRRRG
ncbi:hypothetical protein [Peterkaempfera bronchialis]|uniref:DUF1440 domain-containing protein n=1 Tax=Peterkaempfera bronchialis TaxID=2126346 RepID=A0A345T3M4_9ACTN|nr:hypothetical protein [Peterkaempfera bronchialis]AXI80579.1 hypothetical protein C7M71_027500 [Peterkaempfera bronchialis]